MTAVLMYAAYAALIVITVGVPLGHHTSDWTTDR